MPQAATAGVATKIGIFPGPSTAFAPRWLPPAGTMLAGPAAGLYSIFRRIILVLAAHGRSHRCPGKRRRVPKRGRAISGVRGANDAQPEAGPAGRADARGGLGVNKIRAASGLPARAAQKRADTIAWLNWAAWPPLPAAGCQPFGYLIGWEGGGGGP